MGNKKMAGKNIDENTTSPMICFRVIKNFLYITFGKQIKEKNMHTRLARIGLVLGIYLLVVIASLIFMAATAKQTAFCGVYAMIVTSPWSMLFATILSFIDQDFFDHSMLPGTIVIIVSALINAALILFIMQKLIRKSNQSLPPAGYKPGG